MTLVARPRTAADVEAPTTGTSRHDRSSWLAAGFGMLAAGGTFVMAHGALPDDAYITMSYARNLAEHGHWGLLRDRGANTQTSPLNAWLLAAGVLSIGRPVVAVGALLVATFGLVGWWGSGLAAAAGLRSRWVLPGVLIVLLSTSPLLVSTIGLETYLGAAVLIGLVRYALVGRTVVVGVLCGLAILVRPDLAVPAAIVALPVAWSTTRRPVRLVAVVALAGVVALPWHLFAWAYLGGFVPDTFALKTADAAMTMASAPVGFYGTIYPVATALTALPVVLALALAGWAWTRRRERWARAVLVLVAAGWGHWSALLAIGAYPQAWYFGPLVACSMTAVAVTAAHLGHRMLTAGAAGVVGVAATCLAVDGGVPWGSAPMMTNYAVNADYARVAGDLSGLTRGQPVGGPGEIGVLAFHSRVPVVDFFGDRAVTRPYLDQRARAAGPLTRTLLQWNWTHRPDPALPTLRYRLSYASLTPEQSGRVLGVWPIWSPARGADTLVLTDTAAS